MFPCFLPRRCSHRRRAPGEPPWQCWCPIGEGKSFPESRRLRLWGQGAPRASPRSWPWRSAAQAPPACGKARVLRHRQFLWCAWATQCSSEHVGQVERSSRGSGDFGRGDRPPEHNGGEARGSLRGSSGVVTACVWFQRSRRARRGNARRSQRTYPRWSHRGGGGAPAVVRCGLRGPPMTYVYPDRERGVFRGEKEPAKAVASLLLR